MKKIRFVINTLRRSYNLCVSQLIKETYTHARMKTEHTNMEGILVHRLLIITQ